MKSHLTLLVTLCMGLPLFAEEAPLRKGDDPARILQLLGEPQGLMKTGKQGIYYYPRGEVHTRHGKVSQIHLMPEEEFEAQRVAQARARDERTAEGEALLAKLEERGGVSHLTGKAQYQYWLSFSQTYPEVNVQAYLLETRELARQEIQQEKEEQRLAALEQRVLEAELRAAKAQEQAAAAQQQASQNEHRTVRIVSPVYGYRSGYYTNCSTTRPTPYYGRQSGWSTRSNWQVKNRIGLTGDTTLSFRYNR